MHLCDYETLECAVCSVKSDEIGHIEIRDMSCKGDIHVEHVKKMSVQATLPAL